MDQINHNQTVQDPMEQLKQQLEFLLSYFENPYIFQAAVCLALIMGLVHLRYGWKLLKGIWTCFLGYRLGFGVKWRPGPEVFVVITGASDGIGLEYAKQFAKLGYSLLLIARDEEKLVKVKNELLENYPKCSKVKILVADFHQLGIYNRINEELESLPDIDVLVNNVGALMSKRPNYFVKTDPDQLDEYINVNMFSYQKMIQLLLPRMIQKKRGVIINVSSFSGVNPIPFIIPYSATKAYIDFLTRGLALEYASKGIVFQIVLPYYVETKLIKNFDFRTFKFTIIPVSGYVEACMKTVGIEWKTYGHWSHKIIGFLMEECVWLFGGKFFGKIAFWYQKKLYLWSQEKMKQYDANGNYIGINNNNNDSHV